MSSFGGGSRPTATATHTVSVPNKEPQTLTLRLKKTKKVTKAEGRRRIMWSPETIDNEDANKQKSKSECFLLLVLRRPTYKNAG